MNIDEQEAAAAAKLGAACEHRASPHGICVYCGSLQPDDAQAPWEPPIRRAQLFNTWVDLEQEPLRMPGVLAAIYNPVSKTISAHRMQGEVLGPPGTLLCVLPDLQGYEVRPQLLVWELPAHDVWVVARSEQECWGHWVDHHGDEGLVEELQADDVHWKPLPDDTRISINVGETGKVCSINDDCAAAIDLPCWVWAELQGEGFLAEQE